MDRKVMALGRSSLVISLPKNWMQLNELKKGDVVSLAIQRDRSLVVYPSSRKKGASKEITLRIGQNEETILIAQKIIGAFLNGYSGITLISEKVFSIPHRNAIRNIAGRLYMRIMESDSKGVYMQTLLDEAKASLGQAIQRMHLISASMCEDAITSLQNRDVALAKSVFSLGEDVDHFTYFILRLLRNAARDPLLANKLRIDPLDCMDHQTLVDRFAHAADHSANIARHVTMLNGSKQAIPHYILEILVNAGKVAIDLYLKATNAFFSKDVSVSVEIMKNQQKMQKLDQEIASKAFMGKKGNAELVCAICSIRDDIKRIAGCAANIAEIAVNRAFKVTF